MICKPKTPPPHQWSSSESPLKTVKLDTDIWFLWCLPEHLTESDETERKTEIWRAEGDPESCLWLVHWQRQQHWPGLCEWLQEPSSAFPFLAGLYVEVTPNGRWLDELSHSWLGRGKGGKSCELRFYAQCGAVSLKGWGSQGVEGGMVVYVGGSV